MTMWNHSPVGTGITAALLILVPASPTVSRVPAGPDSPVADAAERGETETVRSLVMAGADVNVAQGDGMTALHWAAEQNNVALTVMLLSAGASPAAVTRIGNYAPLHLAARNGASGTVAALLEGGANAKALTTTGNVTPLHFAARSGMTDAVRLLLEHGAGINAAETSWNQTALMFAAANGQTETVRLLLHLGADPGATSAVVDLANQQQADRAAGELRNQVLETFRGQRKEGDARTFTPREVQAALEAARRAPDAPKELQEDSIDVEEQQPTALSYAQMVGRQGGLTALLHAVREGYAETALALIEGGADVNRVSAGDHTSPMLMAMINGHFDLGLTLLGLGADPNLANDAGTTPLYAALNTHWHPKARYPQQQAFHLQHATYMDVMETLLNAGADPNVRLTKHLWYMGYTFDQLGVNTGGATPFWRAAYATDVAAMKLLKAHGADHTLATIKAPARRFRRGGDEEDPSGVPPVPVGGPGAYPIHAASGVGYGEGFAGNDHRHVPNGWMPAIRYLVEELGVDVNARDLNGYTALHHAAARGDNEMIRYLVDHGADVMLVSRQGQTTVDMANGPVQRIQPFPGTIALLESYGAINNHNCVSCE